VASFKPAYLIHGDDHGRIAERRARLRELAEAESGAHGVELFVPETSTPDSVAAAMRAMTFVTGRRFLIVDGVERWKDRELDELVAAMRPMPPETTVGFFAREDGRAKAPAALHRVIREIGGDIAQESGVKPWELPQWAAREARRLGLTLTPDAARALVEGVGQRQQRLLRELEKLALDPDTAGGEIDAQTVHERTAHSAQRKAWTLADALLAGDAGRATTAYLELRAQGERLPGLIYWIGARMREAHRVLVALERGDSAAQVKGRLRGTPRSKDQLINDARRAGAERLRAAVERVADLELASRGGAAGGAGDDTHALLAIRAIAGAQNQSYGSGPFAFGAVRG
jgi:DNA polymerase-3 subunit delta